MIKTLAGRALLWNILYYGSCVFAILYLLEKDEIINWDVTFVFIPLIFLACSTEALSKKCSQTFKPYNYVDFILKIITFIITQLFIGKSIKSTLLWFCVGAVVFMFIISVILSITMMNRQKNK